MGTLIPPNMLQERIWAFQMGQLVTQCIKSLHAKHWRNCEIASHDSLLHRQSSSTARDVIQYYSPPTRTRFIVT